MLKGPKDFRDVRADRAKIWLKTTSIAPGTFFVAQSWAGCITNMPGFNLRQAHRITATDMTAGSADAQMQPWIAQLQAFFAPESTGNDVANSRQMPAALHHCLLR